ncbi:MAG TPA: tetratricopeptide repeat protein [Candidatus Acidoferrum sp.]|nr:tetratricopeptide repeat protein [Candidatus Acidoferrum sp.]
MRKVLVFSVVFAGLLSCAAGSYAQAPKPASPNPATLAEKGIALAESGHCTEALPLLKKSIRQIANRELLKKAGLEGIKCAMTHNAGPDALPFLEVLTKEFPRDPEVLYAAIHAYSDMSFRTSQDLMREAPFSYQVHELNAEALEVQNRWDEAAAEYRKILDIDPMLPGIHARLGRVLLSGSQPSPEAVAQAKKNFEDELQINPNNAAAEYVLAELAKNDGDFPTAIRHYTRATKIDTGFAEAYLGLGSVLVANKQFTEAIPPLESYEKLAPDSPTGHYQLALAYTGVGRKEDANREAALQRDTARALEQIKRRVAEGLEQQKPPQ